MTAHAKPSRPWARKKKMKGGVPKTKKRNDHPSKKPLANMTESLFTKLRRQHSHRCKGGSKLLLEDPEIISLARHMPRTPADLEKVIECAEKREIHSAWVLEITQAHWRDQEKFNDCVSEMMAFVNGGMAAMNILKNVFRRIIAHYGMDGDTTSVLDACGLFWQPFEGTLKRKRTDDGQPWTKRRAYEDGCN